MWKFKHTWSWGFVSHPPPTHIHTYTHKGISINLPFQKHHEGNIHFFLQLFTCSSLWKGKWWIIGLVNLPPSWIPTSKWGSRFYRYWIPAFTDSGHPLCFQLINLGFTSWRREAKKRGKIRGLGVKWEREGGGKEAGQSYSWLCDLCIFYKIRFSCIEQNPK